MKIEIDISEPKNIDIDGQYQIIKAIQMIEKITPIEIKLDSNEISVASLISILGFCE